MKITVVHDDETLVFEVPDDALCRYSLTCPRPPVTVINWMGNGYLPVCQQCSDFYYRMS